jgi:putative transposase
LDGRLASLFQHQAASLGCPWLAAGIAPDHVHVLVQLPPTLALATLVQHLKGASAHTIHRESWLSQPLRWQNGYWAASVDPYDFQGLLDYLAQQRIHHNYDVDLSSSPAVTISK